MTAAALRRRLQNPIERLFDALTDPARCERAFAAALAGYLAIWWLYAVIAKSGQDIHPDMGEIAVWSHETFLGTPKHPPLSAWLVRAWFDVFPQEPWAYYLFALLLPTLALWIAWRVAGRYLAADKRVVAIAMLMFIPFYNLLAIKFNANTVLTPLWAATTWWFLRSLETRRAGWATLAGVGAAASMLGKYWSVVMLAGLALAALCDPRRAAYFRSVAPWLTIIVGTALLVPHLVFIVDQNFGPFTYAFVMHTVTPPQAALSVLRFIAGCVGYMAAPTILLIIGTRPQAAVIRDTLLPPDGERRTFAIAFVAPFVIATLIAVPLKIEIDTLWAVSAMTLFPVVLLSSPLLKVPRAAAVGALTIAVGFPLVMLLGSPLFASVILFRGVPNQQTHYRMIAETLQHDWAERTGKPLRIVGGNIIDANGSSFYLKSRPATFDVSNLAETPWADEARIARKGMAAVCPELDDRCMGDLATLLKHFPAASTRNVTLLRQHWLGREPAQSYLIAVIPPS
jgi:Dolichyl-phosphate-mannose-protein mannosyltransferase